MFCAVLLFTPMEATEASWSDEEAVAGTLGALTLPTVQAPITCVKSNTPVLGGGLLSTMVDISWAAPAGMPAGAYYQVTASRVGVTGVAPMDPITESTINIKLGLLGDPLGLLLGTSGTLKLTVQVVLLKPDGSVGWTSPPSVERTFTYTAPTFILGGGYGC
ncbi:hypothetical protein [Mycetocola tolaasinivorans]|nr:hypothetical protein [Mycetocola tolaasinivorans]